MDIEKDNMIDFNMSTENMFNNTYGISKCCYHDGKFTRAVYKVYIEKDNMMVLYKSTKNMFNITHGILKVYML